ncbi:methyl-accepting chemotaxis protein [Butyrivibrio sp. DSM 10294]|uniref:methyl-accepting chemotaxis protein n=2 Tax=unclassified Butyrivibrio TaxID=2639466 RepID=UPI0003B71318|nr:methyl-accepting chemotaxis protein [Butyrivibrio sp. DSM 10294]MDC7293851.1 methyl-accepting chemotaxis protein [Butyrivibrio sp. DSM 10294]
MKKMSIRAKMLLCILPVVAIAMILLTYIASKELSSQIQVQSTEAMNATTLAASKEMNGNLEIVRTTAVNIAAMVSTSYKFVDMKSYGATLSKILNENDSMLGSGLWFEPNVFDENEKYIGPYWYKEGTQIVETWDYSNAEYDYLSQEYYTNAKALSEGQAIITNPYYDPTSGKVMSSCSAPIYDNGAYVGCVTVDMELTDIANMVKAIQFGETGKAMLVDSVGTYISCDNEDYVMNGVNISADENAELAALAEMIVSKSDEDPQMAAFMENGTRIIIDFVNIPEVNWKLITRKNITELEAPVNSAVRKLTIICVIALLAAAAVIWTYVMSIARNINNVKKFAGELASGDFTVEKIKSKTQDELGQMSESLNNMFESNKDVITKISDGSVQVSETSTGLANMANELSSQFNSIQGNISGVNDAMMSSGAATEQVNASVEEVNASVHQLAAETEKTSSEAAEIKARAKEIEKESRQAHDYAISIAEQREADLIEANEKAKIVDQIGTLADTIAEIADQINLLSLNASIEAARAGDAGKGFAVVASEINKLASSTSEAVEQIRETIDGVQGAFGTLSSSSGELLGFIKDTVTPDYDKFVGLAKQYGDDADSFGGSSENIAQMVENIRASMEEVSKAIQNIAESTQDTADLSSQVNDSVMAAADVVSNVNDMSSKQEAIAGTLEEIVGKFKIK